MNKTFPSITSGEFIYGTHCWRPPSPPPEDFQLCLTKIKEDMKFDLVKFRLLWNWHHRRQDEFYFDEVHKLFDICDDIGLNVLIELNLESAPYWLEQQHPETRYVNANGRAIELGAQEATPGGGHPGLCFHNDVVMQHAELYVRRLVCEFKDRSSLYIYDCFNEPHLEPVWCNNMWGNMGDKVYCYCDGSRHVFRRWLQKRYRDIETFNETWGRAYTTFEHINPPILNGNYADWLDWMRFWFDEIQANIRWRVKVIKEEDPARKVISHSGAVPPVLPRANACIHNFKFAEPVDMWGTSFAPQAFSWDLATCAQVVELTRSAARGKPFWISEMPGGPGNIRGFRSSRCPRPKDYRLWNWLATALGSHGTMHWCFFTERTGHEAGNFGMMRSDWQSTQRSRAIAEIAATLKEHQDIITSAKIPTQVAVLYDPDNSSLLFAMELEDKLYGQSHTGYYGAIWKCDLTARYITYDTLDDVREKLLVVPMALTMPQVVADKLTNFVREGGTLILEARTGAFDHRGYMRSILPAGELRQAAGLCEGEAIYSDPTNTVTVPAADGTIDSSGRTDLPPLDPISVGPPITFNSPVDATIPAHGYLVPLEPNGAEPIGWYKDIVLAARHTYGKGCVYYFGTYMGLALDKNIPQAHTLIQHILLEHAQPVIRGNRLRPRLIKSAQEAILTVFNDSRTQQQQEQIVLPDAYMHVRDIYSGRELKVRKRQCLIDVEPEGVRVFKLSP